MGQHQVEIGDVDVRLVPVDQRDPISGHPNVAAFGSVEKQSTREFEPGWQVIDRVKPRLARDLDGDASRFSVRCSM